MENLKFNFVTSQRSGGPSVHDFKSSWVRLEPNRTGFWCIMEAEGSQLTRLRIGGLGSSDQTVELFTTKADNSKLDACVGQNASNGGSWKIDLQLTPLSMKLGYFHVPGSYHE
ncbi:hypothetical protein ACOSP7_028961 [Xanthoceras sorbifolium]